MDASFHYPFPLINLGKSLWEYNCRVSPSRWAQEVIVGSKEHYVKQLKKAFESAEKSVEISASSQMNIFRRIMLLPPDSDTPRKEVVATISLILYVRLLDLNILMTPGKVAKIVGCALNCVTKFGELQSQIVARHAIGELMDSGKALVFELDDSLNLSPVFREMMSLGVTSQEIGASGDEIRERIEKLRASEKPQTAKYKPLDIPLPILKRMQWKPN